MTPRRDDPHGAPAPEPLGCEEAFEALYDYLDGELEPVHSERMRRHIEICRRCYPHFDFERVFLDFVREKGLGARKSEELERRVHRVLRATERGSEPNHDT